MKDLSTSVKRIDMVTGPHYSQCRAIVDVAISDNKRGITHDMTVTYPMQEDTHLTMLMKDKETGRDINHDIKFPIAESIMVALGERVEI